jgi:hypothetical protein
MGNLPEDSHGEGKEEEMSEENFDLSICILEYPAICLKTLFPAIGPKICGGSLMIDSVCRCPYRKLVVVQETPSVAS